MFFIDGLGDWIIFFVWGNGSVDYVDKKGAGFKDGTKNITGLEIGTIAKYFGISTSYEYNKMVFKEFYIEGFEPIIKDFDASTWQFSVKLSAGFGI